MSSVCLTCHEVHTTVDTKCRHGNSSCHKTQIRSGDLVRTSHICSTAYLKQTLRRSRTTLKNSPTCSALSTVSRLRALKSQTSPQLTKRKIQNLSSLSSAKRPQSEQLELARGRCNPTIHSQGDCIVIDFLGLELWSHRSPQSTE